MSAEKTTLELIAPTVEEAVNRGLSQLGLPADAVDVEVLDAGSRGLFGIGSRQARVRLTIKSAESSTPKPAAPAPRQPARPSPVSTPVARPAAEPVASRMLEQSAPAAVEIDEERSRELQVAESVVRELLEKMQVRADVLASIVPPADSHDQPLLLVEVHGDDLSILIGRRSETLNALQYITSLIVSKELDHWVQLSIDIQGYRARRERQLRVLARRMADQAVHTGRRQTLEPMPANERRVVHLELRDHPDVFTESTGEEPNRKVTISVKKAEKS